MLKLNTERNASNVVNQKMKPMPHYLVAMQSIARIAYLKKLIALVADLIMKRKELNLIVEFTSYEQELL